MVTILDPKDKIARLWGYPDLKETSYRLMKYLLRVEVEKGVLLHNVVTGHLIFLTNEEAELLSHLPQKGMKELRDLVFYHFLVPEDFDEYKSVNQLRSIYQRCEIDDAVNHYIILPTTYCNAHCFYCYESDYPRVHMTEDTACRIIDYIDKHRKGKDVTINWFGGEPLVGIRRIDQISQGLKDRGIPLSASMISNGYLFDEKIVERAVELWKLQRIQITLDGTEEIYNRVKAYGNVSDNPFQRVLRNIDLLSGKKIQVNIRLNVDFYNKEDIRTLIEVIGQRYSENRYVTAYLNMLFNDQGFKPVRHSHEDMVTLANLIDDYTKLLKEQKVFFDNGNYLHLLASHCMADNPHAVMIQPDGSLCRCEHENILDSYGNIESGVTKPKKLDEWKVPSEPSEKCPDCAIFPACYHLQSCMNSEIPCLESFQLKNLERQKQRIQAIYIHKMEEKENENI